MRTRFLIVPAILIALVVFATVGQVQAGVITAHINMDNSFVAYLSTDDSVQGTQFLSGNHWPNTYTGNSPNLVQGTDYYLHVFGSNITGPAGFLGEFTLSGSDHVFANNTQHLLTNTTDWSGNTTGWSDAKTALTGYGTNGVAPWGTRTGVDGNAEWLWSGNNTVAFGTSYFSTKISALSAVPEPASLAIFGTIGLIACGRRRKS